MPRQPCRTLASREAPTWHAPCHPEGPKPSGGAGVSRLDDASIDRATRSRLIDYRFDKTARVGPELTHQPVMVGVLDGDRLEAATVEPEEARFRIGHQHRR